MKPSPKKTAAPKKPSAKVSTTWTAIDPKDLMGALLAEVRVCASVYKELNGRIEALAKEVHELTGHAVVFLWSSSASSHSVVLGSRPEAIGMLHTARAKETIEALRDEQ